MTNVLLPPNLEPFTTLQRLSSSLGATATACLRMGKTRLGLGFGDRNGGARVEGSVSGHGVQSGLGVEVLRVRVRGSLRTRPRVILPYRRRSTV